MTEEWLEEQVRLCEDAIQIYERKGLNPSYIEQELKELKRILGV